MLVRSNSPSEEGSDGTGDEILASKKKEKKRRSFNHRKWRNPSASLTHQGSSPTISVHSHHLGSNPGNFSHLFCGILMDFSYNFKLFLKWRVKYQSHLISASAYTFLSLPLLHVSSVIFHWSFLKSSFLLVFINSPLNSLTHPLLINSSHLISLFHWFSSVLPTHWFILFS